jgi:hypothetical protein
MNRMGDWGDGKLRSAGAVVAERGFYLDRMTGFSGWGTGKL